MIISSKQCDQLGGPFGVISESRRELEVRILLESLHHFPFLQLVGRYFTRSAGAPIPVPEMSLPVLAAARFQSAFLAYPWITEAARKVQGSNSWTQECDQYR